MNEAEDNIRLDPRLIRIGLEALNAVSDAKGIDFFLLSMDNKKEFLVDFGPEIVGTAKRLAGNLGRYFEDRMVVLVENDGAAGLYFVKIKRKPT